MLTRRRKSPILVPRFSFSLSHKDTGKQKERNGERKKDEAKRPKKRNIQRKVDKKKEAIIKATGVPSKRPAGGCLRRNIRIANL